jgi:hypothetical protein
MTQAMRFQRQSRVRAKEVCVENFCRVECVCIVEVRIKHEILRFCIQDNQAYPPVSDIPSVKIFRVVVGGLIPLPNSFGRMQSI